MAHKGKLYPINQRTRANAVPDTGDTTLWPAASYICDIPAWSGTLAGSIPPGPYNLEFDVTTAGHQQAVYRCDTLTPGHSVLVELVIELKPDGLGTHWWVQVTADGVQQIQPDVSDPGGIFDEQTWFAWVDIGLKATPVGSIHVKYTPY